jgi:serine/threonine protein kinase
LRSPAVATTYDIGEDDGTLFIVMELVEGETLSDRLQRGPLSVRQTLGMTLQIADALDEATASASFTEMSRPQIW